MRNFAGIALIFLAASVPALSSTQNPPVLPPAPVRPATDAMPTLSLKSTNGKAWVADIAIIEPETNGVSVTWIIADETAIGRVPADRLKDPKILAIVPRKPGTYVIYGVASNAAGVMSAPLTLTLEVADRDNKPGPGPGPDNKPVIPGPNNKPLPPGEFGLAQVTYDALVANFPDPAKRKKFASAVASNYRGAASAIDAGALKTGEAARQSQRRGIRRSRHQRK